MNLSNCLQINAVVSSRRAQWREHDAEFINSQPPLSSYLCKCIHLCDEGI